jgi:hypothetical protein
MDSITSRFAWLPQSSGKIGKAELGRALAAWADLEGASAAGAPGMPAFSRAALEREPFLRYAAALAAEGDRQTFHEAIAAAFRAGAFPWVHDPMVPVLALEIDAFLSSGGKPLRMAMACQNALALYLERELSADRKLKSVFDAFFRERIREE